MGTLRIDRVRTTQNDTMTELVSVGSALQVPLNRYPYFGYKTLVADASLEFVDEKVGAISTVEIDGAGNDLTLDRKSVV